MDVTKKRKHEILNKNHNKITQYFLSESQQQKVVEINSLDLQSGARNNQKSKTPYASVWN